MMIILTKSIQEIDILVWDGPSIIKDHGQGLPIEELNGMELISRIHRCETLVMVVNKINDNDPKKMIFLTNKRQYFEYKMIRGLVYKVTG